MRRGRWPIAPVTVPPFCRIGGGLEGGEKKGVGRFARNWRGSDSGERGRRYTVSMEKLGHHPSGYCPKCHYPVDPGLCPECGTRVSQKTILSSLDQTRAARTKRWTIRVLLFVVVPSVVIYGATFIQWRSLLPTAWLLSMQTGKEHWASAELLNRYAAGSLSPANAQRFIDKVVLTEIEMRNPAPLVQRLPFRVDLRLAIPNPTTSSMSANVTLDSIWVDGRQQAIGGFSLSVRGGAGRSSSIDSIQGLGAGDHQVELRLAVVVTAWQPAPSGRAPVCTSFQRSVRKAVTVRNAPATQFVRLECSPELTKSVESNTNVRFSPNELLVCIYAPTLDISLAGRLFLRPTGAAEFTDFGEIVCDVGVGGSVTLCNPIDEFADKPYLDVRIVPDADVATQYGEDILTRIYGCPLQWNGVRNLSAAIEDGD